jgi:ParB-like chromosome segregation protein Spo0J
VTANILPALQPLAVPIDSLTLYPGNPRRGDVEAVARSLNTLGQHRPCVVDSQGQVVVGNHMLLAARQLGWTEIAAFVTDDSPEVALSRLLADNKTAELGTYDEADLVALIESVSVDPELLEATAWTQADLGELVASVNPSFDPADEDDQGTLDHFKAVTCPSCGEVFEPNARPKP